MQFKLLGIKIDNFSKKEIIKKIELFLNENKLYQIATINPEFILESQKNDDFKTILNNCELNIADGIGLKFAFWRFGRNLKCCWHGVDLMWRILEMASDKNISIFLLANKDGLSSWEETAKSIQKIYPNLRIFGVNVNKVEANINLSSLSKKLNNSILFCNFGAPFQESVIFNLKKKNINIKIAMGVGGSFDFITGKIKRAPKWIRFFEFEWFWRLIRQPHRVKRIFNAIIIFPIKIVFAKIKK